MSAEHSGQPSDPRPRREITDALVALRGGAPGAFDRLMPLVYDELRRIAHRQLRAERTGHTLSTTALVHESYLKLVDQTRAQWTDRAQFFGVAAHAMRRILVDYARRHGAKRRGKGWRRVEFEAPDVTGSVADDDALIAAQGSEELLALDEALERLAALHERLSRVVECRYFGGLTDAETAAALGVTVRTVGRDWVKAKGWLYRELRGNAP